MCTTPGLSVQQSVTVATYAGKLLHAEGEGSETAKNNMLSHLMEGCIRLHMHKSQVSTMRIHVGVHNQDRIRLVGS